MKIPIRFLISINIKLLRDEYQREVIKKLIPSFQIVNTLTITSDFYTGKNFISLFKFYVFLGNTEFSLPPSPPFFFFN